MLDKRTDNEIIKALNECLSFEMIEIMTDLKLDDIVDLITRLQAENETLRNVVEQKHIIRKDGKSPLSLIKAEAVKEFAERSGDKEDEKNG